jgi:ribosomal 50S subunit-associated protein YjgA (DUF615 family)
MAALKDGGGTDLPVRQRLALQLQWAAQRQVQPEVAADLVNRVRRLGPGAHGTREPGPAATNGELMAGISDRDMQAWYQAQGVRLQDVAALRRAAFMSGLANPSGTFLHNATQYVAAPWLSHATGNHWTGALLGLGTVTASAPLSAFQQTAVVTLCESIRNHEGPVAVLDSEHVNDKHWLLTLSRTFGQQVQKFSELHEKTEHLMERLGITRSERADAERLQARLDGLPPADLQQLRALARQLLDAEKTLHKTQRDFLMTQGSHERQWKGSSWQVIPRTLRSPVSGFASLMSKTAAPPWATPTLQTACFLLITAIQHLAAALDEPAKQDYNSRLNLLYGDFFTDAGRAKLDRGEAVTAADIDTGKLRGFIRFPAQSLVKHAMTELKRQQDLLAREMQQQASPGPAAGPSTAQASRDLQALERLGRDLEHLESGDLTRLQPGGLAEALLVGADQSVLSEQLWRDVVSKYTLREFSAQTAQRIGQIFHLGVLGSGASSILGTLTSAARGGTRHVPLAQSLTITALSGLMSALGASNVYTAVCVKNSRREVEPDIGFTWQALRGVLGGLGEALAQRSGRQASRAMNEVLAQERIHETLRFAEDLQALLGEVAGPESTVLTLSLPEAAAQLRPGHVTPTGTEAVAIDIPAHGG